MEDNRNLVAEEEVAENVEQTTEETQPTAKTYTQEEVDAIVGKAKARARAKIEKEKDREYGELIDTLKAGTGKESVEEINTTFRDFYEKKGINIPKRAEYSNQDIETLAKADAEEIIRGGFDEVVEEVDRLTELGVENMTPRDKAMFRVLAAHRQATENSQELAKIGVTKDVYESEDFKSFAAQFNPNIPIADIYDIYTKTKPKKNYQTIGSMKQSQDSGVKDYYSPEEIERLTEEDLDDPKVWEAVRRSMTGG